MKKNLLRLFLFMVLLVGGCSLPNDPGLPTWETNLKFYFLNDSYDLLELAEEDSAIVVVENAVGDSILGIQQTETNEQEINVGSTETISDNQSDEIGIIELPDMDPINGSLTFLELAESTPSLSDLVLYQPAQGQIPMFDFADVEQSLEPVEEIEKIEIAEGGCEITITNNMMIGLGYEPGNPLEIRLVQYNTDSGNWENVITGLECTLAVGESYTVYRSLAEHWIYQEMKLLIGGGSPGSGGNLIDIEYDSTLDTEVIFDLNMTAHEAVARVKEQVFTDTLHVDFDPDYRLYEAEIAPETGIYQLKIDLENELAIDLELDVTLPTIYLDDPLVPYTHHISLAAAGNSGSSIIETLEMAGYNLGTGTELLDQIPVITEATVLSSGNEYRDIKEEDSYHIEATINELKFEYLRGIIAEQEQEEIEEEITIDVDYPEIEDGGEFNFVGESEIRLHVNTGISKIPGRLLINAIAINESNGDSEELKTLGGDTVEMEIPNESDFELVFSSEEYNINQLLSVLPEKISFSVIAHIGNATEEVVFQRGDMLRAEIEIEAELALESDAWAILKEDGDIQVSEEDIELEQEQYDAMQRASVILTYTNTTGMSVSGNILLSDSRDNIVSEIYEFDNPDTSLIDLIEIPMLSVTSGEETKTDTITVLQTDLDYLLSDISYIASRIKLQSPGNQAISGEVRFIGQAEIVLEISNDLTEDEED